MDIIYEKLVANREVFQVNDTNYVYRVKYVVELDDSEVDKDMYITSKTMMNLQDLFENVKDCIEYEYGESDFKTIKNDSFALIEAYDLKM